MREMELTPCIRGLFGSGTTYDRLSTTVGEASPKNRAGSSLWAPPNVVFSSLTPNKNKLKSRYGDMHALRVEFYFLTSPFFFKVG